MFYRNDTAAEPYPLQLPGCALQCPLQEFVRITKLSISEDREEECELPSEGGGKGELLTHTTPNSLIHERQWGLLIF